MIDEHLADQARRDTEKMGPALPIHRLMLDQAQIGLVHQSSGLQRGAGPFGLQVMMGQFAQLRVDQRHEAVQGLAIAMAPGVEQLGHVRHWFDSTIPPCGLVFC